MTQLRLSINQKGLSPKVDEQISNLRNTKHPAARRYQIVLICEAMKKALKGGV